MIFQIFILVNILVVALALPDRHWSVPRDTMHSYPNSARTSSVHKDTPETTAAYWHTMAKDRMKSQISKKYNTGTAKNVIMFLGDGMSLPTIAATRAYLSQLSKQPLKESQLSFEKMPNVGLSKTHCVDTIVADSACSATAYLGGVKANEGTIGVTAAVGLKDCNQMKNSTNHVSSIGRLFQLKGKRTGIVTTTRITHASPSGVYAHTANRDWETDSNVREDKINPNVCRDIAYQLVHGETGKNLNVIFGGGRQYLLPNNLADQTANKGYRSDGRNLIEEWKTQKRNNDNSHKYVYDRSGMLTIPNNTEYVMGLFAGDHIDFNLDRSITVQPSLTEMTVKAIDLLSTGEKGYFLFVEGGRIDHAHHYTQARKALDETVELHKAIQAAIDKTDTSDTLIVVTADHSHTMSLSGYPDKGSDILGISGQGEDGLPYTILGYANGPGYKPEEHGERHDISHDDFSNKNYRYPSMVPLPSETHGGEDVGIFAQGPWSHLFNGVLEQNVIPHIMAYASCVNNEENACSSSRTIKPENLLVMLISVLYIVYSCINKL